MDLITIIFVGLIVVLFFAELFWFYPKNRSIRTLIVTVGVLGTFVGIVIGLWGFNYKDVEGSLETLLNGLKTAFITSVAGMSASIILTFIEKFKHRKKEVSKDESEKDILGKILYEIQQTNSRVQSLENSNSEILAELQHKDERLDNLEKLNDIAKDISEISLSSKRVEVTNSEISTKLDNLETISTKLEKLSGLESIETAITNLEKNQNHQNEILIKSFGENFENMNSILNKTFEKISEGASKEIINALQEVIKDFNNNLTESGENFKQLNSAVTDLVTWQENYKSSIIEMEKSLDTAKKSMEQSEHSLSTISDRNSEIIETYSKLSETIETYKYQTDEVNRHLETYSELSEKAKDIFPNIEKGISKIGSDFQMTTGLIAGEFSELTDNLENSNSEQMTKLKTLISDMEISISQNGEKITKTLNSVSSDFEAQKSQIAEALTKQGEVVIKISEKIPEELANFEGSFTGLTNSFLQNYKKFLDDAKKLMDK